VAPTSLSPYPFISTHRPPELPFLFLIAAPSVCCFKTSLLGWPVLFGFVFSYLDRRYRRHYHHPIATTSTTPCFRRATGTSGMLPAPHPPFGTAASIDALPAPPARYLRRLCPTGFNALPFCLYPAMVRHPTDAPHRLCPNGLDKCVVSVLHTPGYTLVVTRPAAPTAFPMQPLAPPALSASSAQQPFRQLLLLVPPVPLAPPAPLPPTH
jgi:hypothetical protein